MASASAAREMLWVFLAGGSGACLRVLLAATLNQRLQHKFPFAGTLIVNLLGCLAIGVASASITSGPARPIVLGGLLGGFTTYSAFSLLSWDLLRSDRWWAASGQIALHIFGGLACVWAGITVVRLLNSR